MSIYKNTLVVGTYSDDTGATNAGSAYVFEKQNNRWVETQLLLSDDIQATDRFGYAVSVHENTITVAAYDEDEAGSIAGALYIFNKDPGPFGKWRQKRK